MPDSRCRGWQIFSPIAMASAVEVAILVDVRDSTEEKRTRKAIVFFLQDGSEEIIPRGTALYWMVRHYRLHSDERFDLD